MDTASNGFLDRTLSVLRGRLEGADLADVANHFIAVRKLAAMSGRTGS